MIAKIFITVFMLAWGIALILASYGIFVAPIRAYCKELERQILELEIKLKEEDAE